MNETAAVAYVLLVVALWGKFVAVALVQGRVRLRTGTFQYAEDAAWMRGQAVDHEDERVIRAQRVLRNDGESQPYVLELGAAYVALGGSAEGAVVYFGGYALSRVLHGLWLLRPRQPHRNRAYAVGLLLTLALAVHTASLAFVAAATR